METFKAVEKELKFKPFSKEGLNRERVDPATQEREEMEEWITDVVSSLSRKCEILEAQQESLQHAPRKGRKGQQNVEKSAEIEHHIERNQWHISKLELIQRKLANEELSVKQVAEVRDDITYYLDNNEDPDFAEDEGLYDELGLDEELIDAVSPTSPVRESSALQREDSSTFESDSPKISIDKKLINRSSENLESITHDSNIIKTPSKNSSPFYNKDNSTSSSPVVAASVSPTNPKSHNLPKSFIAAASAGTNTNNNSRPNSASSKSSAIPAATQPISHAGMQKYSSWATAANHGNAISSNNNSNTGVTNSSNNANDIPTPISSINKQSLFANRFSSVVSDSINKDNVNNNDINRRSSNAILSKGTSETISIYEQKKQERLLQKQQEIVKQQKRLQRLHDIQLVDPIFQPKECGLGDIALPNSFSDLVGVFNKTAANGTLFDEKIEAASLLPDSQIKASPEINIDETPVSLSDMLLTGVLNIPEPTDSEKAKHYMAKNPYPTPSYYPQLPLNSLESEDIFQKFDPDVLFFIFYYQQGIYQQYLAACELKRKAWRFHKKYLTWFQRHEEPKEITNDYELGTYIYFDYEGEWCQRRKADFRFEYKYLEDVLEY